jgi:hypothetical protein
VFLFNGDCGRNLGRWGVVVLPEVVVMGHTKIAVQAVDKDMRGLFPVWRRVCTQAERVALPGVRTIVVGVDRMKK